MASEPTFEQALAALQAGADQITPEDAAEIARAFAAGRRRAELIDAGLLDPLSASWCHCGE